MVRDARKGALLTMRTGTKADGLELNRFAVSASTADPDALEGQTQNRENNPMQSRMGPRSRLICPSGRSWRPPSPPRERTCTHRWWCRSAAEASKGDGATSLRGDPSRLAPLAPPAIMAKPLRRDDVSLCGDTHYFFPFTAASRLAFAEPGCNGFCWLSCGAQPDSQITSKVARMRPSASAKRSP